MKTIVLFLAFLFSAGIAHAETYWVQLSGGTTGNCSNAKGASDPGIYLRTVNAGLACLAGGDTLSVGAGNYDEGIYSINANVIPNGTAGAYTIIKSTSGSADVFLRPFSGVAGTGQGIYLAGTGSYIRFDGIGTDGVNAPAPAPGSPNIQCCGIQISGAANSTDIHHIEYLNAENKNNKCGAHGFNKSSDVLLQGLYVHGNTCWTFSHGFYVGDTTLRYTINRNRVEGMSQYGMQVYSTAPPWPADHIISYNIFANNGTSFEGGSGISAGGSNTIVIANLVYGNYESGIRIQYANATNVRVYNNTAYNNGQYGIWDQQATASVIRNNLAIGNSAGQVNTLQSSGADTATASNNVVTGTATSHFADAVNNDFRLCTAAGVPHANCTGVSSAIDAGADLGSPYNVDIVGTSRPQGAAWDVGAYESGGAGSPGCPTTPALVARYSFDGSNANDTSGNANHGTHGGGVTYAAGKYGQGAVFGGAEAIAVADATSLWLCASYTIAGWIKPTTTPGNFTTLVSKRNLTTGQGVFVYSRSDPAYCGSGGPLAGYNQISNVFTCYTTPFSVNVFAYYAETWDGTTLRKYINGTLITSLGATAILTQNADPMLIGGSVFGEFFTGVIDEVIVLNCALGGSVVNPACAPVGAPSTIVAAMNTGAGNMVSNKFGVVTRKFAGGITRKFGFLP